MAKQGEPQDVKPKDAVPADKVPTKEVPSPRPAPENKIVTASRKTDLRRTSVTVRRPSENGGPKDSEGD
jgi:hypothetical protein